LVSGDGSAYTTTAGPTPFSDNFALIGGSFDLKAVDATLVDGPDSGDQVDLTASFPGPDGKLLQRAATRVAIALSVPTR
jgi:hypothetical protein